MMSVVHCSATCFLFVRMMLWVGGGGGGLMTSVVHSSAT